MLAINVHNTGGSGPYGASAYRNRATGCVERMRLDLENPRPCDEVYKPTPTGQPNAMLVGTMVHALAEHELKGVEIPDEDDQVVFEDVECGWDIPREWQLEALRVYRGWVAVRKPFGTIIGAELLLKQPPDGEGTHELGFPLDSKIDLLQQYSGEDFITLTDFKTSATSVNNYTLGDTRIQQALYCINGWSHGYNIGRLEIRQIVKTKEVKEIIHELPLPTPLDERWLARYLQGALAREARGMDGPQGAACDFCPHKKTGACKL